MEYNIDIIEQNLLEYNPHLLDLLLLDHTTGGKIRWATDDYLKLGELYKAEEEITLGLITGANTHVIQPRVSKTTTTQESRTKGKAEVFTPSWICNEQNNLIDSEWFGRNDVFNVAHEKEWASVKTHIEFPNVRGKTWQDYVDAKRLEISCGEAPYLVSRYDTVTGEKIPIRERIGLLDRKMRVINENAKDDEDWERWVIRAYESTYGFDYQGDNVLLARENLLLTYLDYYQNKHNEMPELLKIKKIANIISWNIWQMDGIKMTAPFSKNPYNVQISLFDKEEVCVEANCMIMDWRARKKIEYSALKTGKGK